MRVFESPGDLGWTHGTFGFLQIKQGIDKGTETVSLRKHTAGRRLDEVAGLVPGFATRGP
jgi:hypothetical protein